MLLCASTVRLSPAVVIPSAHQKRRKVLQKERAAREGLEVRQASSAFQNVGDAAKRYRWLVSEMQPES